METLKISKEKIISAYIKADVKGKELLEEIVGKDSLPKPIAEQLDTFDDILKYHGITPADFEKGLEGLSPDEKGYRKEKLMVAAYNQGQLSDFTDGTPKYCPIFKMGSPSGAGFSFDDDGRWNALSNVGARQIFCGPNAKENMYDAVEKFIDIYKESRTL